MYDIHLHQIWFNGYSIIKLFLFILPLWKVFLGLEDIWFNYISLLSTCEIVFDIIFISIYQFIIVYWLNYYSILICHRSIRASSSDLFFKNEQIKMPLGNIVVIAYLQINWSKLTFFS